MSYVKYVIGKHLENDIITGNNIGDLGIISCGKYIVAKEKAH